MTTIKIKKTEYLVTGKKGSWTIIHALTKTGNLKKFGEKLIKKNEIYTSVEGQFEILGTDAAGRNTYSRATENEIDFGIATIN